jgi:hypothetical protein
MKLPFTVDQFFEIFKSYNQAVFPVQFILILVALVAIFLTFKRGLWPDKITVLILSLLWAWMGVVYHILFFSMINKAAYLFGILNIFQAALFFYFGIIRNELSFRFGKNISGWIGAVLVGYALVIYPALGYFLGHRFPSSPTFGLPCPTTIFSFGLLLWTTGRLRLIIMLFPVIWALIGTTAAIYLRVYEDFGLLFAGSIAFLLIAMRKNKMPATT